jgi:hypothetical protein
MAKKLTAKIGEYEKDGQTKGRYVNIGVVMKSSDGGEYVLLDPTVSLAGVMAQQNTLAMQNQQPLRDRIMVGVWEEESNAQQYNQQAPQQYNQQAPAPQNHQHRPSSAPSMTSQQYSQQQNPNDPPF